MTVRMTIILVIIICFILFIAALSSKMQKATYRRTYDRIVDTIDNKKILNVWIEKKINIRKNDFKRPTIKVCEVLIIETVDSMNNEVEKERFLLNHLRVKYKTDMTKLIERDYSSDLVYLSYERVRTREDIKIR